MAVGQPETRHSGSLKLWRCAARVGNRTNAINKSTLIEMIDQHFDLRRNSSVKSHALRYGSRRVWDGGERRPRPWGVSGGVGGVRSGPLPSGSFDRTHPLHGGHLSFSLADINNVQLCLLVAPHLRCGALDQPSDPACPCRLGGRSHAADCAPDRRCSGRARTAGSLTGSDPR
jgi:hypothetical protein